MSGHIEITNDYFKITRIRKYVGFSRILVGIVVLQGPFTCRLTSLHPCILHARGVYHTRLSSICYRESGSYNKDHLFAIDEIKLAHPPPLAEHYGRVATERYSRNRRKSGWRGDNSTHFLQYNNNRAGAWPYVSHYIRQLPPALSVVRV